MLQYCAVSAAVSTGSEGEYRLPLLLLSLISLHATSRLFFCGYGRNLSKLVELVQFLTIISTKLDQNEGIAENRIASRSEPVQHSIEMTEWISTKKAMHLLGVGSTTIKRWTGDGKLPFVRTAGGHRRFRRSIVESLLSKPASSHSDTFEVAIWMQWLCRSDIGFLRKQIVQLIDQHEDCFAAADFFGELSAEIQRRWAFGKFSVVDGHIATAKLSQTLAAVSTDFEVADDASACLLATFEGDQDVLGLVLTQLCLRSIGINALWVGVGLPVASLVLHVRDLACEQQILALTASSGQMDNVSLRRGYRDIAAACRERDFELVLGGDGGWPEDLDYGHRCNSFNDLKKVIERPYLDA